MLGGFLTLAQDLYVEPSTALAEDVKGLFNITLGIAIVVFVLVEGLLLYMIFKFRKNTRVPRDETHRGHTTAEVVWTVIPAAILLFLGFLSAGTLIELDSVPETKCGDTRTADCYDFTVQVEASQFQFQFRYPDENGTDYNGQAGWCNVRPRCPFHIMRVEEGSRVRLEVTARDVIHAFAIPEFALKLDAVPGKRNYQWFEAPMLNGAPTQEFFIQCMEYCGTGHHRMGNTAEAIEANTVPKLIVFPKGSQPLPWGAPPAS